MVTASDCCDHVHCATPTHPGSPGRRLQAWHACLADMPDSTKSCPLQASSHKVGLPGNHNRMHVDLHQSVLMHVGTCLATPVPGRSGSQPTAAQAHDGAWHGCCCLRPAAPLYCHWTLATASHSQSLMCHMGSVVKGDAADGANYAMICLACKSCESRPCVLGASTTTATLLVSTYAQETTRHACRDCTTNFSWAESALPPSITLLPCH